MSEQEQEMSDEEAIMKIASAMKDNTPTQEEKQNVHTFLFNVALAKDTTKIGNLRDDDKLNELGIPRYTVRGSLELARISDKIMNNSFFSDYFKGGAEEALSTSLSREGFLIKQATTQTKQVADVTRRRKINKGWFKSKTEESGGDTTQTQRD